MWPEPNDDPNIPYVWGLSGYSLGNPNGTNSSEQPPATTGSQGNAIIAPRTPVVDVAPEHSVMSSRTGAVLVGSIVVLGAMGFVEGLTEDESASVPAKVGNGLLSAAMYATGVGYFVKKALR